MNGRALPSSPGPTCAPHREAGASPRTSPNLPAWIVKAVGGSTTHWAGASLRFDEHEFKDKSTYGNMPGANLLDWPITLAEMEPWYAKAEDKMGVTRTNGIPGLPGNNNFKVLEAGAKKLGYKTVHTGNMAINSEPRDGRGACQQIGFCFQGCKSGAKWSTLYTEIPKGEATGNLEVRPNSMAIKIEHDASGKVTGVVYADESGAMQRQKARVVAVAGNSIESPRLLLNSASTMFPDGLANSSGQVGRNYMRHMTGSVYAAFEKSVHMYRGTTMAGIIRDEAKNDPKRGFVGGYEMETLSIGVPFMAAFLNPGAWGRSFTSAMESYPRMAGMWLVGEDMPQETNRITLDPKAKDKFGMPVASVHFDDHPNDVAMRDHAYKQGAAVYEAVGATVTYPTPPYPEHPQPGHQPDEREAEGWRGQQVRPDPRRQEPVRLRRQPVHQRRGLQSDADDRLAGDPAGGPHRRRDAAQGNLTDLAHECEAALFRIGTEPFVVRHRMRDLFGRVENGRGTATKFRHGDRALGAIDQAGTAQQRGEIIDLAVVVEHLVVQRGEELREAHPLLGRDLLQRVPERHFQPDRGAMAADPQRPGLRFIVALRLVREQMAHGVPPVRL